MRPIHRLCVPLLALWLGGCASATAPMNHYVLPADAGSSDARVPSADDTPLLVSTPRLANYLEAEGIVLQLDDISLNEARSHQWRPRSPSNSNAACATAWRPGYLDVECC